MDPRVRQRRGQRHHERDATAEVHRRGEPSMEGHISCLSWMLLIAVFYFSLASFSILEQHHLPSVKKSSEAPVGDFTEERARRHLENFVKVGARSAGSYENDVYAVKYITDTINQIKMSSKTNKLIEVDLQRPTGSFHLPFLDDFTQYYANISNTVIRVTSPKSDDNALLLNCHTDSAINAPGASDDAVACSILLEIFRAIVEDDTPLIHPLILLFNGAEENLLQASHGFITQHKWAKQIKAFINLEAAGAGGKEFLFQTGPENTWLVWAWAQHAPHPHGSSMGQDLFQSGVIPSDTDFRIFRDHGKIPGVDLAYIKNGYVYHTMHDSPDMIHEGCIQRAGENIIGTVRHLVQSEDSLLPDPSEYRHGHVAYFDLFGFTLVVIPVRLLLLINYLTIFAVLAYIGKRMLHPQVTGYSSFQYSSKLIKAVAVNILAYTACFLSLSLLAGFLTKMGRSMSWFSQPPIACGLYLPAGLLGLVVVHHIAKKTLFKGDDARQIESLSFDATLIMWTSLVFQCRNFGSSYLFLIPTLFSVIGRGFFGQETFSNHSGAPGINRVVLYLGVALLPTALNINKLLLVGSFFFALAGRSGSDLPPEVFAFTIVGLGILVCFSFQAGTVYLVNSLKWFYIVMIACVLGSLAVTFTSYGFPFDSDPLSPANKRFYMQHGQRDFYNQDGSLNRSDAGMFVFNMDYVSKGLDVGPVELMNAKEMSCKGTYCEMPWVMPIHNLVRSVQFLPTPQPSASATTDLYPFTVKWRKDTRGARIRVEVSIVGPPHMALHIAPLTPDTLVEWSFHDDLKKSQSKNKNKETYFILYGGGIVHPAWNFWLEFIRPSSDDIPLVELAVTAHYSPHGQVSRVNKQTPELKRITEKLHDWVAPMTWISLYRNYLV